MSSGAQLPMTSKTQTALRLLMSLQPHLAPCSLLAFQKAVGRLPSRAQHGSGEAGHPCVLLRQSSLPTQPRQSRQQPSPEALEEGKEGLQWHP